MCNGKPLPGEEELRELRAAYPLFVYQHREEVASIVYDMAAYASQGLLLENNEPMW